MPHLPNRPSVELVAVNPVLVSSRRGRGPLARSPLSPLLPAQTLRYVVPGSRVDPVKVLAVAAPIFAILIAAGAALVNLLGWDAPQIRFVLLWPILAALAVGGGAFLVLRFFRKP